MRDKDKTGDRKRSGAPSGRPAGRSGGASDFKGRGGKPGGRPDGRKGRPGGPKRDGGASRAPQRRREEDSGDPSKGERIAKVMARAGLCSRRDAEVWIANGRVELNGKTLETPAVTVTSQDKVLVDGEPLPLRERTRLWLYHKPKGLVTTNRDPEGRPTVFEKLPRELPRVMAVGRLDINTEGLLLLTNDGGLARVLELPATGWLRRYRVRAFGKVTQPELDTLADGVAIDGVLYGSIEATLDKEQGNNVWMTVSLREGKNREVKRVLEHLGLAVNRLIRLSFGPFQLMDMPEGDVREIRGRVLRDQLGEKLIEESGADFEAPLLNPSLGEETERAGGSRKSASGGRDSKPGFRPGSKGGEWMSAKEGAAAKQGRKSRSDEDDRRGGPRGGGRKNQGERQQKVSPRSRFRMTSEPGKRFERDMSERPNLPQRRIWGDEGLVEDKQQERRMGRDRKGPSDRSGPGRGRSDRGSNDRGYNDRGSNDRGPRGRGGDRGPRGDRD